MTGRLLTIVSAIAVLLLGLATWQERRYGAAVAREEARGDSLRVVRRQVDSLRFELRRQVPVAVQWRDRWRTVREVVELRDTLTIRDTLTVRVPVTVLVTADSAIEACHVALGTCVALQDSLTREAGLWRRQYEGAERLRTRPWTAAGLVREADGALGAFVDRDVWRLRLGASVSQDPVAGARLQLRIGLRW